MFTPGGISANIGDTIVFQFESGNHSLTEAAYDKPCEPLEGGIDSGLVPNLDDQIPYPTYTFRVDSTSPQCEISLSFSIYH